jgi:hypothetical protein
LKLCKPLFESTILIKFLLVFLVSNAYNQFNDNNGNSGGGFAYYPYNNGHANVYSNNQNYNGNARSCNINNQRPLEAWFDVEANANVNWNDWICVQVRKLSCLV